MHGYDFHPKAEADLNEIWDYLAPAEDPGLTDRIIR